MNHDQQNIVVFLLVKTTLVLLLWIVSQVSGVYLALAIIAFSFIGLTNYALIHEACHSGLHRQGWLNGLMGMVSSWLFPVSFTFMAMAHKVHHINNRTDNEMFDYYYPHDNLLIKYGQWYSILIGIYPPIIPVGSILMALMPWIFWLKPWQTAKSSSIIFNRLLFPPAILWKIRLEVGLGVVFWYGMFQILHLDPWAVLWLYMGFWFNWSTRQYVTHAFSDRDVMNGAHNLKVDRVMGCILLNGQWDLVHHNYPRARWQTLPVLGQQSRAPIGFWKQYFKQWLGPRPNNQPAPTAKLDVY